MDIGSVWYMLHEISAGDRSYTQELTKKRGFVYIGVGNRSDLLDYLVGRTDSCPGLVLEVIDGRKRPRGGDRGDLGGKRQKVAGGPKPDGHAEDEAAFDTENISHSDVTARVRAVKDLDVLARCPGRSVPNVDLILRIAQEERKNWHCEPSKSLASLQSEAPKKMPLRFELEAMLMEDATALPIILVPCNKSAPVNLLNAVDFFQHGLYVRPDEERVRFFESTRPEYVQIKRNIGGKQWTFEVRDSATKFTKSQWMRTVGVVCDGTDWQFKGWPFESHVDIFATMKAVFFQEKGIPVPVHVTQWQVTVLTMSAMHLEHRFAHVRDSFFELIEGWLRSFRQRKFMNNTAYAPERRKIERALPIL
jgi:hypothetical protein